MKPHIKYLFLVLYFWITLTIAICWVAFGSDNFDNYGPLFYMIFGFPFYAIIFIRSFYQFGNLVETKMPEFFKKNTMNYGVMKGDVLDMKCLFEKSKELKLIKEKDLKEMHKLTILAFRLMLISFGLAILIGIGLSMIK